MTWGHVANAGSRDRSASNFCPEATSPADHGPVISTETTWSELGETPAEYRRLRKERDRLLSLAARQRNLRQCRAASLTEARLRAVNIEMMRMETTWLDQ